MVQYEIKINGRVQGVGFRYYTQKQARIFELTGWVKNTVDGGVVVLAQGEEAAIRTFIDYLWIGPTLSRVTNITQVEMQILEEFSDFQVRY
ncbi:acylphosphatase [Prolixibacteraceae bacterium Z1-6]|uniref:Acylphosphatase n=1 Tax=Draconibacterium aestuarii TaxID=2998507 RepID=A0A9X3F9E2_9BACT|nr:acylphosphatase [Prolixibacteraceae bacterium Z1-6]